MQALTQLVAAGGEISLRDGMNHWLWLGMGYAVAKGWAAYRGDDLFRIMPAGRVEVEALKRLGAEQASTDQPKSK